jgi:hypothetical protein
VPEDDVADGEYGRDEGDLEPTVHISRSSR